MPSPFPGSVRNLFKSNKKAPEPGAGSSSDVLSGLQVALTIVKESINGLPVVGLSAAVGGFLAVITAVQSAAANREDIAELTNQLTRLRDSITEPLKLNISRNESYVTESLQVRVDSLSSHLTKIASDAEERKSRGQIRQFLASTDDIRVIQRMNRDMDRAVQSFLAIEIRSERIRQDVATGFRGTGDLLQQARSLVADARQDVVARFGQTDDLQKQTYSSVTDAHQEVVAGFGCTEDLQKQTQSFVADASSQARNKAQLDLIYNLLRAYARYDSAARNDASGCFEGTRKNILAEINQWISNVEPDHPPIFWLCGLAGIGKSTIAQTVAERQDSLHQLGASFFSHDETDRRNPLLLFPTLAFRLALFNSDFKRQIAKLLEEDPDAGHAVIRRQIEKLVVEPLRACGKSTQPIIIVLDALDECSLESEAEEILILWAASMQQLLDQRIRILVTSRPELHIRKKFQSRSLKFRSQSYILHDIEASIVRGDIEHYLRHQLNEVATNAGLATPWPTQYELGILVKRA